MNSIFSYFSNSHNHLLKEIAQGNRNAFEQFYNSYKITVFNTVLSYVQHHSTAEDLTQDVFLKIFQKADSFQGNAKVSTWVYRISVNTALNHLAKQKRRPSADEEIAEYHKVDFIHPGVTLENIEKSQYLYAAINNLADAQKTAFILSYIEDLPRQQVADIMEVSLKSVEGLLQRAKANLRQYLISFYNAKQ